MTTSRKNLIVLALVLLALCVPFSHAYQKPGAAMDEGMILVYPELLLKGNLPYRDFETFYGPGNIAVLAAAYAAFGTDVTVERSVGLLYRLLIVAGVFFIAKRWGTVAAGGAAAMSGLLLLPTGIGAYTWIGAVALAIWSIWCAAGEGKWRPLLAGWLGGTCLMFRPDCGPAVILAALPLFLYMSWTRRWHYLAGAAAGVLPLAILAVFTGPTQVLNNLLLYPVLYSSPGRKLPLGSAETYILLLLAAHAVASVINLTAGWLAMRAHRTELQPRLLLAVSLFAVGVTHQALQRADFGHVIAAAFLSISVLPLGLLTLCEGRRATESNSLRPWVCVLAVTVAIFALLPELLSTLRGEVREAFHGEADDRLVVERNGRYFPHLALNQAQSSRAIVAELQKRATPGQRLFVGPGDLRRTNYSDTYLYHLMPELRPATYFLEMNPLSANRPHSRLAADVKSADWLVLNRAWNTWDEPNRSREYGSDEPNQVVADNFEPVAQSGTLMLLARKPPAGVPGS